MIRIAILMFPGAQSLDITGPMDVFAEANRFLPHADHYQMRVLGTEAGPLACSNGMLIQPHAVFDAIDDAFELLIVAGGPELPRRVPGTGAALTIQSITTRSSRYAKAGSFTQARLIKAF